jgi:catechol 2,3-dioxygenase-like lactoylglutathione lyase family enzyme
MLDIVKVDHVGIRVSDKDRSIAFYERLGYSVMADAGFEDGHPIIMQHSSGLVLNLLGPATGMAGENVLMDVDDKFPGYTHVALHIESVEAAGALVEKLGIAITGRHKFKGIESIFIRDPDRNVIELVQHTGPDFFTQVGSEHHR